MTRDTTCSAKDRELLPGDEDADPALAGRDEEGGVGFCESELEEAGRDTAGREVWVLETDGMEAEGPGTAGTETAGVGAALEADEEETGCRSPPEGACLSWVSAPPGKSASSCMNALRPSSDGAAATGASGVPISDCALSVVSDAGGTALFVGD